MYHLGFYALEENFQEEEEETQIPDELWSNEPLSSTPGQPRAEVGLLADKVEERRLKRMGVLRDLLEEVSLCPRLAF